jgi:hypothetical protein
MRLETLSTFDFGTKKGFCLTHFGPNLPSPSAYPFRFYWAGSLVPLLAGRCVVLGHIEQI